MDSGYADYANMRRYKTSMPFHKLFDTPYFVPNLERHDSKVLIANKCCYLVTNNGEIPVLFTVQRISKKRFFWRKMNDNLWWIWITMLYVTMYNLASVALWILE